MKRPAIHLWITAALFYLASARSAAQEPGSPDPVEIGSIGMAKELRPFIATAFIGKTEDPINVYPAIRFTSGPLYKSTIPDDQVTKKALIRFQVHNGSQEKRSVFFFPGFYYTRVQLYRVNGTALQRLPDIPPDHPEKASYRSLEIAAGDTMTVVAECWLLKTYTNKIRPRLVNPEQLDAFIQNLHVSNYGADLFTYVFCGLLLMMILYSVSALFQGANKEFLYYSGYGSLIGLMLFTKALYGLNSEPLSFFLEAYLDFVLQCTGIIFYMLFMQRFLGTRQQFPFLHKLYKAGIFLLALSVVVYTVLHYATDLYTVENMVETVTKLLLLVMILVFLGYSLRHWNNKLLRFLFWGNLVYLLFSLVSLLLIKAPHLLPLSGIAGNSLVWYEAGIFFELVFFLAGLNYKNRRRIIAQTREREALKAQTLLQEYEKEIAVYKAQQEERQRISADMHDELGSGMTAIRLMSEIARNKMKENTPAEIERISRSADDVLNKMNAIIWSMNSSNDTLDNLVSYIRAWSLEYFESTPVTCRVNTPDDIPKMELSGDKRRNIFLCVKETLNNVLKHAAATHVTIDISAGEHLGICITDDGKGIDLEKIRAFGNGLKNIRRRMESIGGQFTIENRNGTVTTLRLPL